MSQLDIHINIDPNFHSLLPVITTGIALTALICGLLLLVTSPRLVYRIAHAPEQSSISQSLLIRWGHLFWLEIIACMLIYSGTWLLGLFSLPSLLLALGVILLAAMIFSCLLGPYL